MPNDKETNDEGNWEKKYQNKLQFLNEKIEYDREHGFREPNHYQLQGGILKYHQWITLLLGIFFTGLALLHQRGSFLYFYLFGLVKIGKDTANNIIKSDKTKLSPLLYYILGGAATLIVLTQVGYPIPDMTYGLIYNTNEVIP